VCLETIPGQLRLHEHIDFSTITLLLQLDYGGLEVSVSYLLTAALYPVYTIQPVVQPV